MRTLLFALLCWGLLGAGPSAPEQQLLIKYNWEWEGAPQVSTLEVPDSLTGLPFYHYQAASKAIGLDLNAARGLTVTMKRYPLKRRTHSGDKMYAIFAVNGTRVVGAWLCTDAPVAPGIGALTDAKFGSRW